MTRQVEALLTEHFRYTPLSLIDDIINTVNTIIYRAIEAIENGLFSIPPQQLGYSPESDATDDSSMLDLEHPEAKAEIENGVHQLETLLEATVDRTFDKFEIYTLRNILTVPDNLAPYMRLGHYEVRHLSLSFPQITSEHLPTGLSRFAQTMELRKRRASHSPSPPMPQPQNPSSPSGAKCKKPANSTSPSETRARTTPPQSSNSNTSFPPLHH
ncbi:MAG: hypothetical protein Q9220_004324 [cf. Caloplaca sp. 1 TL-2023]